MDNTIFSCHDPDAMEWCLRLNNQARVNQADDLELPKFEAKQMIWLYLFPPQQMLPSGACHFLLHWLFKDSALSVI